MVRALGYSENHFDPTDPGRLCRGRERWIEPWEFDAPQESLHRTVISGAVFSDDGASDARRGLPFSGVDFVSLVDSLFGKERWIVFMEDGHPADIPSEAQGVEAYEGYRAGGREQLGLVRWWLPLKPGEKPSPKEQLRALIAGSPIEERIRGLAIVSADTDVPALMEHLFALVGFSTLDSPPARYQPSALPEILSIAEAVLLVHRDKHGPAAAIYARAPIPKLRERLTSLCEQTKATSETPEPPLLVPFAIPPMLARWDRALAELKAEWAAEGKGPFPVPVASFRPGDGPRRRWSRDDEEVDPAFDEPPPKKLPAGPVAEE